MIQLYFYVLCGELIRASRIIHLLQMYARRYVHLFHLASANDDTGSAVRPNKG